MVTSDEAKMTAHNMGQNFIESINTLFDKWTPTNKFDILKVDEGYTTYNPNPVQYTPEFKQKIKEVLQ